MKKTEKESDGESEENVYSQEVREDLIESGEISPEEEGFMVGYDEADEKEEEEESDDDKDDKDKKDKDKEDKDKEEEI